MHAHQNLLVQRLYGRYPMELEITYQNPSAFIVVESGGILWICTYERCVVFQQSRGYNVIHATIPWASRTQHPC